MALQLRIHRSDGPTGGGNDQLERAENAGVAKLGNECKVYIKKMGVLSISMGYVTRVWTSPNAIPALEGEQCRHIITHPWRNEGEPKGEPPLKGPH